MKPLRWLLCGLVMVAAYRVTNWIGIQLFSELKEALGIQVWIANICAGFGFALLGAVGEWFYRFVERRDL